MYYAITKKINDEEPEVLAIFNTYNYIGGTYRFFQRLRLGIYMISKDLDIEKADEKIYQKSSIKTNTGAWAVIKGNKMPYAEFKDKNKNTIRLEVVENYNPTNEEIAKWTLSAKNNLTKEDAKKLKAGDKITIYGETKTVKIPLTNDYKIFLTSSDNSESYNYLVTDDGFIYCDSDFKLDIPNMYAERFVKVKDLT